jgi:hypothetical protein
MGSAIFLISALTSCKELSISRREVRKAAWKFLFELRAEVIAAGSILSITINRKSQRLECPHSRTQARLAERKVYQSFTQS